MTASVPVRVHVRMYQIGFGDCFLVSFEYDQPVDGRSDRHILIDFGSVRRPQQGGDPAAVANLIAQHCHGHLDAVVVTHRHKDHLSGFAHPAAGQILDGLQPRHVVRSWTEKPDAATGGQGVAPPGEKSKKFVTELATGQSFAALLEQGLQGATGARGSLRELAAAQAGNAAAIARLDGWAQRGSGAYVQLGGDSGIEQLIPGIKVHVLGPPIIEECPEMRGEAQNDPEYWLYYHALLTNRTAALSVAAGNSAPSPTPTSPTDRDSRPAGTADRSAPVSPTSARAQPGPVRWLLERMRGQRVASVQRVVHTVDDALNNTSVMLLIEVGDKRLLFPGDAQIEIWRYALSRPGVVDLLSRIDLYKVGHHGSRNATPRSLVKLWNAPENAAHPITALMSTLEDVYGESEATAVPRTTLVAALKQRATLLSTNMLPQGRPFAEVVAEVHGGTGFEVVGQT